MVFKIIFIVILFVGFSYLFAPYLIDLFGYFSNGYNQLSSVLDFIIDFLGACFNALAINNYLMVFFVVLSSISIIFYLIRVLGDL